MYKRIAAAALVFGTLAIGPPAEAQVPCFSRDALVNQLSQRFGESRQALGLRDARSMVEIWASDDSGTWTMVLTRSNGTSCVIASGVEWHNEPQTPAVLGGGF